MERLSKLIDITDEKSKGKPGVSFYSGHEHSYFFIETTHPQRIQFKCLVHLKSQIVDVLDMP